MTIRLIPDHETSCAGGAHLYNSQRVQDAVYHWWIVMLDSSGYLHALRHSMTCHHILYHKIKYIIYNIYNGIVISLIYPQKSINILRMLFLYYKILLSILSLQNVTI